MTVKVSASIFFEVEVKVSGSFVPGTPAWGGSRLEPALNPPEPDSIEDVALEGISLLYYSRQDDDHFGRDLLDGVDLNSPAIQKLFANIQAAQADEIHEALLGETPEPQED